jgi:hypothetical protein
MPYSQRVRGIEQSEMHARGLLTGSTKFRVLSGDLAFRFELDTRERNTPQMACEAAERLLKRREQCVDCATTFQEAK